MIKHNNCSVWNSIDANDCQSVSRMIQTTVSIFDICMFIHFDKTHAYLCPYTIHSERLHMAWNMHVCVCVHGYTVHMSSRIAKKHGCPSLRGPWMMLRSRYFCPLASQATSYQGRKLQGTSGICWRGHLLGKKSPLLDVFPASTSNSSHKISSLFAPTTKTMEKTCLEAETTNWIIKWCLKL